MPDEPGAPLGVSAPSGAIQPPATPPTSASTPPEPGAAPETFFDASTLPQELQGRYKDMQGAFTQKTQALAEANKGIEAIRHQAGLFQALSDNPAFQQWMARGGKAAEPAAPTPEPSFTPDQMADLLTNPDKFRDYIRNQAIEVAKGMVTPVAQKAEQVMADRTIEAFEVSHPDMKPYKAQMAELLEHGVPSLDLAYKLVKYDVIERETKQRTLAEAAAKAKQISTPVSTTAGTVPRPAGKLMGMFESADLARQQLAAR